MEKEFKTIKALLLRLINLQQQHIDTFEGAGDPDIDRQSEQRKTAFSDFRIKMDRFIRRCNEMNDHELAESMLLPIQDSVNILYEQNRILVEKVTQRKQDIQDSLKQLSKGKQAMGGYGAPAVMKNKPRVISLTN